MDGSGAGHYPRPQLDLELLRTFVAAVDTGSLTNAGHLIGRSQSTISGQISKLETLTKSRLLMRSKQGVSVTPEGAVLLSYARDLLRIEGDALAALRLPAGSGKVRLGTQESFAVKQLPPILNRFMKRHPTLEIEMIAGLAVDLTNLVRSEELDLVLMRQVPAEPQQSGILWREPMVWVGQKKVLAQPNEPLPLVIYPQGCFYRDAILQALADWGIDYRLVYTSSCSASLQSAVRAGLGISAFAVGTIAPEVPVLGPDSGLPPLGDVVVRLHRSRKKKNAAAEALGEFLEQHLRPKQVESV